MTRNARPQTSLPRPASLFRLRVGLAAVPALLGALACQTPEGESVQPIVGAPVEAGVGDPALSALAAAAWEQKLAEDPFEATYLGEPRHDGEVPDVSRVGREKRIDAKRELLGRARRIDETFLSEEDAITRAILIDILERDIATLRVALDEWTVDPVASIATVLLNLSEVQPYGTAAEREQMVARWSAFPSYIRESYQNLRLSLAERKVASRNAVSEVIAQIDAVLETPPMDSPLVQPALGGGRWVTLAPGASLHKLAYDELGDGRRQKELRLLNPHLSEGERVVEGTRVLLPPPNDPLEYAERGRFLYDVLTTVERKIYPALATYRDVLAGEVLPAARPDDKPGLAYVFSGESDYRDCVSIHTTLPLDPKEIHEFGLREVERIRAEIAGLGRDVFGTSSVPEIQHKLRSDTDLFFDSRDEVEAKAVEALARASAKLPQFFGILPRADCEVVRTPAHEEAASTIAYYRAPAIDGSRPGRYYINTYQPVTRPRYDAEVLAFHEAVPGHHLQIAISQELTELPSIRRHAFHTAFGEGWALYTERLADEMGLYSSDLDRFGVLSFDAWRASRLVVDTGLHAMGWSRERAIDYLYENTLLALNNCENEVDRYIAWPGQALAYKLGQREILRLRDLAQEELGWNFDYREFHDRVLEKGSLPLGLLAKRVEAWIAQQAP